MTTLGSAGIEILIKDTLCKDLSTTPGMYSMVCVDVVIPKNFNHLVFKYSPGPPIHGSLQIILSTQLPMNI